MSTQKEQQQDTRDLAAPDAERALRAYETQSPLSMPSASMQPTYYVRHPDDTYSVANPQPCRLDALIHARNCMAMLVGLRPEECIGGDFVKINDAILAAENA